MLGILGSMFGVLGIFTFGLLFVPLGLLCTLFSFFKREILLGLVSLAVNVVAIFVSPTIWLVLFGAASTAPPSTTAKQSESPSMLSGAPSQAHLSACSDTPRKGSTAVQTVAHTRFGNVKTCVSTSGHFDSLSFQGVKVFDSEGEHVDFVPDFVLDDKPTKALQLGDSDVVVFYVNGGGSGSVDVLGLLVIDASKKAKILRDDRLTISPRIVPVLSVVDDKLLIDFGINSGISKQARFDGHLLQVSTVNVSNSGK